MRWLTRRYRWAATAWRLQTRVSEVHGSQLASAVTLSAFTALFPLLLVVIAVVGFISHGRGDEFVSDIIEQLGLSGQAADAVKDALASAERTRLTASIVGFAGLLWSALGLVGAIEAAFDAVWQVGGRGIRGKLYNLGWGVGFLVLIAASAALTALVNLLPGFLSPVGVLGAMALGGVMWLWTFKTLTNRPLPWGAFVPGSIVGALGLQVLTLVGTVYVPRLVASSSALYGSVGVVLAVLAWLLLFGRLAVYAAVLNVVRWEDEHGTVSVEVELPHVPGSVPVEASRSGEEVVAAAS